MSFAIAATAFLLIFPVELPDKTFIATLVLATRYKPLPVWIGVVTAFAVQTVVAVSLGDLIGRLPRTPVEIVAGLMFLVGGLILIRGAARADSEEAETEHEFEAKARTGIHGWRIVATSFLVLFVAEWGDLSQLLTAGLVVKYQNPVSVGIGAFLALATVSALGAMLGRTLLRRISLATIRRVGGGVCVLLAAASFFQVAQASSAGSIARPRSGSLTGPIVVIGSGGLSWSDVSPQSTPALWSMLRDGASATLSIHSVHANTCPVDGWLMLSAGEQAGDPGVAGSGAGSDSGSGSSVGTDRSQGAKPPCAALPERMSTGPVPHWDEYRTAAAATRFDASLGLLGEEIAQHGGCVLAIGPGAALGAARANGTVDRYQGYDGSTLPTALSRCPATLVDVGSVRDPADTNPLDGLRPTTSRARQVAAVDARVAAVLKGAPSGSDVLVAGLADAGVTERLRLVAAVGPRFGPGTLQSGSTRQPGLVQLADLTPTIFQHLGITAPTALGGAPLHMVSASTNTGQAADQRLQGLLDDDEASYKVHSLVEPFFYGWALLQLALYLIAALLWWRGWGTRAQRQMLLGVTRRVAIIAATVPASTFLANILPWWRFSMPMVSVVASVALFATAISMLALLGPWRRHVFGPMSVVCGATMAVLALDVMTGSRLQISSLLGLQPVIGGRFYGMGNVTFALFGTATLLLCIAVGDHYAAVGRPRLAAAAVASIGLIAVIVDASPWWGSDLGGPTALLPAVILLALMTLRIRLTWRRLLAIGGGIGAFVVLLGLLDWLRPAESRSHLGRFVQTALDGGAWDIVLRKLEQNIAVLLSYPLALLIPVGLVLVAYLLAKPTARAAAPLRRSFASVQLLRPGLIALIVMWVIGFVLNDSGAVIPAIGVTLAIPLMIALALRTLQDEQSGPAAAVASRPERLRQ